MASMRNATSNRLGLLASACSLGLCASAVQASSGSDSLGQWREYARRGMAPEYSWAQQGPVAAPTVLSSLRVERPGASGSSLRSPFATLSVRYSEAPAGYAGNALSEPADGLLARDRSLIRSEFVTSSLGRRFAGGGQVEVTAVVAHQRYASAGFGTAPWVAREDLAGLNDGVQERSSGHGVRVDYRTPVSADLTWNLTLQSKLDMDAFESYRGVYADVGDFDLPARVQTQLQWDLAPNLALAFGVERVFYSGVSAFTSAALPIRFLSLLGDGGSPEFAWRDLTVYSMEAALADGRGGEWGLRYTTRQQPSPTSALLDRVMSPDYTDTNLALSYRRELGDFGQFWLAAAYAPSRYFLGPTPYHVRDLDGGSQVELEALWSIPF